MTLRVDYVKMEGLPNGGGVVEFGPRNRYTGAH